jgi:hypothetical protein
MIKAEELARLIIDEEFVCSAGLIDRFKSCHISCRKVSSEVRAVNCETAAEWLSTIWPKLCQGYPDTDIFNSTEVGLLFRLISERTLRFKGEKYVGGKLSKDVAEFSSVPMWMGPRRSCS